MNPVAEAQQHAEDEPNCRDVGDIFVWVLLGVYAFARVLQVYPGRVPMLSVVALHVLPPAIFAVIHGTRAYRLGGILTFVVITLIVGNFFENLGIRTGFPFGSYYFTDLMGPKLSAVPITLGLAYVGMAYLSWTLARIILGGIQTPLRRLQVITVPVLASCIMVSWDLSQDPIWSTVLRAWVWLRGGAYFGVPFTNFFGWFLTVYVIYQLFVVLLSRQSFTPRLSTSQWRQAVIFYGTSAAGNFLLVLPQHRYDVVTDATGVQWSVNTITQTCAIVTMLTMGVFTAWAWQQLRDERLQ
jgi:putative membrane protein